jgi:AcrR family transcriptional regulator
VTTQAERRATTIAAILRAARSLFTARGFEATSIDDIAADAGVAKGAVYHHFDSKEQIFGCVFEEMSAELATLVPKAASAGKDLLDSIGRGTLKYLTTIASDDFRQILLLDGPAVLGWQKWREIDVRYFGQLMDTPLVAALKERASDREIEALSHLITGAVTEAALVCAVSEHRNRTARDLTKALQTMLSHYFRPSE